MSLPHTPQEEFTLQDTKPIPEGSMAVNDFCAWSQAASIWVQNAVVTDMAWWAENDTLLKHQFIILRLAYNPLNASPNAMPLFYDIKIERLGKHFPSFSMRASDVVTIQRTRHPWDSKFLPDHTLFFALGSHLSFVFPTTRHSEDQSLHPATASDYLLPLTQGISVKQRQEMVEEKTWSKHDPSSTGHVFRFLHHEERRNGILMYLRLIRIIATVMVCAITAALAYAFFRLARIPAAHNKLGTVVAMTVLWPLLALCFLVPLVVFAARNAVTILTQWQIRRKMESLIKDLGSTDYIPPLLPIKLKYRQMKGFPASRKYRVAVYFISEKKPWSSFSALRAKIEQLAAVANLDDLTPGDVLREGLCSQLVHGCVTSGRLVNVTRYLRLLISVVEYSPDGANAVVDAGILLFVGPLMRSLGPEVRVLTDCLLDKLAGYPETASSTESSRRCAALVGGIAIPEI
ncbi:hypothetical protein MIND_00670300 [Mycena indigotica]|uniref:Uncharacterized protein n=1 Tax=Mycena indigotica TaxID=2126181 RepID=A0A8H6W0K2_9AGAR|nr:uncharacterized protein MIND_00670300 [Mycena indigotica]KAF7301064.1 hypothetical protein MIND_00670300 [Mycena indigotica]